MSGRKTSKGLTSAISSPESRDGRTLSNSQAGHQPSLFGPAPAPVSPSLSPVAEWERKTSVTSGQSSFGSLRSAVLQRFLESRLRVLLEGHGSMEYSQDWKVKTTPAGRRLLVHTASVRRTSATEFSGWRTPQECNAKQGPKSAEFFLKCVETGQSQINLTDQAKHSGQAQSASHVSTEKRGALAPELCRWLMGFPREWEKSAPSEMQLSRRLPRNL